MAKRLRPHNEMFKLSDADLVAIANNVREEQYRRSPGVDQAASLTGMESAKRAVLIGATGGHSMLFIGRKASGKTSLRSLAAALDHFDTYEALPCPCGNALDPRTVCHCNVEDVRKTRAEWPEVSMYVETPLVPFKELNSRLKGMKFSELAERKSQAAPFFYVETFTGEIEAYMKVVVRELGINLRQYGSIRDVATTIARLDGKQAIEIPHLMEAINYRCLIR